MGGHSWGPPLSGQRCVQMSLVANIAARIDPDLEGYSHVFVDDSGVAADFDPERRLHNALDG